MRLIVAVRVLSVAGLALSILMLITLAQAPGEHTRGGQNIYHSQEAHDDVQDLRLDNLEKSQLETRVLLLDLSEKQAWIMGGIAGFGGVLTLLQFVQMRKMK